MRFSIKKPKAFLWKTNHSLEDVQERLANGRVTGDWLICPHGEADHAVPVSELLDRPTMFDRFADDPDPSPTPEEPIPSDWKSFDRRHDLDALRALAMLLGIGLHAALAYVTFPFWPVHDSQTHASFDVLFSSIHGFRMPLFFMISGFFTAMLWRKRGLPSLFIHRSKRILLPLVIFTATIIPLMNMTVEAITKSGTAAASQGEQNGGDQPNQEGQIHLWEAAKNNDIESLKKLLESGEDPNVGDPEHKLSALHWAALNGSTEAAKLLVEAGAEIDAKIGDGSTALLHAAFTGHPEIITLLLEKGADPNTINMFQSTPLDTTFAEWELTKGVADALGLQIEKESLEEGRKVAREILQENGGKSRDEVAGENAVERNTRELGGMSRAYLSLISSPVFYEFPIFGHLWFLWFLCLLIFPFAVYAMASDDQQWGRPPESLFVSPFVFLWLIPVTMIPQSLHGLIMPNFGPDTAIGLLPPPHILLLYAVFFFFGALYFDCDDKKGKLGRRWWLTLPIALLVVYPLGVTLTFEPGSELVSWVPDDWSRFFAVMMQALYAWLMIFGLIGLFRKICSKESRVLRYVSDSSYWLYVAHLPLIFIAQYLVKSWNLPAFVKFGIVCVSVTAVLLLTYEFLVRYTWLGTLLNGKRKRPSKTAPAS